MADPKRASSESEPHSVVRKDSGARPSVERVERETTPAPAGDEGAADAPSSFPTTMPDRLGQEANAVIAAFRSTHAGPIVRETGVPLRTKTPSPPDLDVRLAFLLLHVDGASTVRQIAELAGLAPGESLSGFVELFALGLVDFRLGR